jgi:hypothetical protein
VEAGGVSLETPNVLRYVAYTHFVQQKGGKEMTKIRVYFMIAGLILCAGLVSTAIVGMVLIAG